MAKRKAKKAARDARPTRRVAVVGRSAKRPTKKKTSARKVPARAKAKARKAPPIRRVEVNVRNVQKARKTTKPSGPSSPAARGPRAKVPRLDRVRRTLEETVPTPPSSLDMNRRGSAARTGRAELAEKLREHHGMAAVTGGDPDVNIDDAYFTGEEAPGGDNPTPDQDIVDDIGKALGVEYEDNEELKGSDKVVERDRHRWELDPASSEDFKERK